MHLIIQFFHFVPMPFFVLQRLEKIFFIGPHLFFIKGYSSNVAGGVPFLYFIFYTI